MNSSGERIQIGEEKCRKIVWGEIIVKRDALCLSPYGVI